MAEPLRELGSWAPAGPARDAGPAALRGRSWVRGRLRGLSWGNRPHFGADQPRRSMRWADVYVCMLADGVALRNRCPQGQADPRAAIAGGASGVTMARAGPHPRRARHSSVTTSMRVGLALDAMGRRLRGVDASMSPAS